MLNLKKNKLGFWVFRLLFCVAVIVIYQVIVNFAIILNFFHHMLRILKPFIIGGSISFLFFPICKRAESLLIKTNKKFIIKHVRGIATFGVMLVTILLIISIIFKIVPILYEAILKFAQDVSYNLTDSYEKLEKKVQNLPVLKGFLVEIENQFSLDTLAKILMSLDYKAYFGGIANLIFKIFNIFVGIIISIYILLERHNIKKTVLRVCGVTLSLQTTNRILRLWKKIKNIIYIFIFGQIIDAFIVGCCLGIILSFLNIKNSIVFAMIYFIFAMIPYFGSIIAVFFIALLGYVVEDFNGFLTIFILTFLLQQIDSNIINPKIVGQAVGVNPLYVILGITLFGGIFGVVGLFLGPPLMVVCLEMLDDFITTKENKKIKNKKNTSKEKVVKYFSNFNEKSDE